MEDSLAGRPLAAGDLDLTQSATGRLAEEACSRVPRSPLEPDSMASHQCEDIDGNSSDLKHRKGPRLWRATTTPRSA
jgi:hypothetical protein